MPGNIIENILGTLSSFFQLDEKNGGPKLTNVGGALEVRSPAGAYVPLRGAVPSFARVIFVDGGTAAVTGDQKGSQALPYKTISQALTAAAAASVVGTLISIAPYGYVENLTIPDLDGLCLYACNPNATSITNTGNSHTINWAPATGQTALHTFRMEGLQVINNQAGKNAYNIDGSNVSSTSSPAGTFLDIGHETVNCIFSATATGLAVMVKCAGMWNPVTCVVRGGVAGGATVEAVLVQEVAVCVGTTLKVGDPNSSSLSITYRFDATQPIPVLVRSSYQLTGASAVTGNITLQGHPSLVVAPDSGCYGNLVATSLSMHASPNYGPLVFFNGVCGLPTSGGAISITTPTITQATIVDFSNAKVFGAVALVGAGATRLLATARGGAYFLSTVAVGASIDFDIRGSFYKAQGNLSASGNGTIDRDGHNIMAQAVALTGTALTITPPFPASPVPAYTVTYSLVSAAAAAASVKTTLKVGTGFTATAIGVIGTYDVMIRRAA